MLNITRYEVWLTNSLIHKKKEQKHKMKTKGELIAACIKLMFDNDTNILDPENISDDPEYASRTANIIESINRAFNEVAKAEQLPRKRLVIDTDTEYEEQDDYYTRYNLDNLVGDVYRVNNINYQDNYGRYYANVGIRLEGENILVLRTLTAGKYIVTYSPMLTERLTYDMPDNYEIQTIAEDILDIVPYFVKGDLYEEDNADTALMAINRFHIYLANRPRVTNTQSKVKTVYTQY